MCFWHRSLPVEFKCFFFSFTFLWRCYEVGCMNFFQWIYIFILKHKNLHNISINLFLMQYLCPFIAYKHVLLIINKIYIKSLLKYLYINFIYSNVFSTLYIQIFQRGVDILNLFESIVMKWKLRWFTPKSTQ